MSSTPHHWRDIAIAKSEIITDAWEVTKAYSARIAEWVLFICMIFNIVEILPGVHLLSAVSNAVLATQVVALDIAGFGLASMADHARRMGNEAAAKRASGTGYFLIGIMLATLLVVTVGILWPGTLPIVAGIEKVLILVRVLMIVIYGHVIHGLRVTTAAVRHTDEQRSTQTVDSSNGMPESAPDSAKPEHTPVDTEEDMKEDTSVDITVDTPEDTFVGTPEDSEEDTFVDTDEHTIVDIQEYRSGQKEDTTVDNEVSTKVSPKVSTKVSTTTGRGTAQQKALRILKKNPGIGAGELARKAGISRSYANKILAEAK